MDKEPLFGLPYLEGSDLAKDIPKNSQQLALDMATALTRAGLAPDRGDVVTLLARIAAAEGAVDRAKGWAASYRKRIVHNLVYQHSDAAAAVSLWGAGLYPQGFAIDPIANEIFTVSGPPQIVSVYNWKTGAYKGVIFNLGRTGVSESLDIRYESGKRYLYTVDASGSSNGQVVKFDITALPATLTTLTPVGTASSVDVLNSIHYRFGHWISASGTANSGTDVSYRNRGRLTIMDDTFKQTGYAEFPSTLTGGTRQYQAANMPKMQGFDEGPGFFAFGIGGGWNPAVTLTPYHYEGVRILSATGNVLVDSLCRADKMLALLNANGCQGTLIENEGVQIVDGKVYTIFPINSSADTAASAAGGIVILEEMSSHPDAIDFSSAAANWTMPDAKRLQSGSHPRAADGKLHNLITWDSLTSLVDICTYMQAIGQDRFAFYSSDATINDVAGNPLPAGYFVEVLNRNFSSFVVRLTGPTTRTIRVSTDGTTWAQTIAPEYTLFDPASPLVNVSTSTTNRMWLEGNMVNFQFAVKAASGALPAGNNVILATGGLPAKFRPDFSVNAIVGGHASGPGMRFSADNTGLVQLVGVPASTHNYATGTVSWPAAVLA